MHEGGDKADNEKATGKDTGGLLDTIENIFNKYIVRGLNYLIHY